MDFDFVRSNEWFQALGCLSQKLLLHRSTPFPVERNGATSSWTLQMYLHAAVYCVVRTERDLKGFRKRVSKSFKLVSKSSLPANKTINRRRLGVRPGHLTMSLGVACVYRERMSASRKWELHHFHDTFISSQCGKLIVRDCIHFSGK